MDLNALSADYPRLHERGLNMHCTVHFQPTVHWLGRDCKDYWDAFLRFTTCSAITAACSGDGDVAIIHGDVYVQMLVAEQWWMLFGNRTSDLSTCIILYQSA